MNELSVVFGVELEGTSLLEERLRAFQACEDALALDFVGLLNSKSTETQSAQEYSRSKLLESFGLVVDVVTGEPSDALWQKQRQLATIYMSAAKLRASRFKEYLPDLAEGLILSHNHLQNYLGNMLENETDEARRQIMNRFESELDDSLEYVTAKKEGREPNYHRQKEAVNKKPYELIEIQKYPSIGTLALVGTGCFLLLKLKHRLAKGTA